jgi:hypothetical protein
MQKKFMAGNYAAYNARFDEVKSDCVTKYHRLMNIDLMRLGIFSKNSIDEDS